MQTEARADQFIDFAALLLRPLVFAQRVQTLPQFNQRRDRSRWIRRIVARENRLHFARYPVRLRHTRPRRVDITKEIAFVRRFAVEELEVLLSCATLYAHAEALALVHRAAGRRDLWIGFAEQRLDSAGVDHCQARRFERNVARLEEELRRVPENARRLPRLHVFELLWITLRVGRGFERFERELRGRG